MTYALSEEKAHPTIDLHLCQLSVDIQLNGPMKCREASGVQMQLTQVIFRSSHKLQVSQLPNHHGTTLAVTSTAQ